MKNKKKNECCYSLLGITPVGEEVIFTGRVEPTWAVIRTDPV